MERSDTHRHTQPAIHDAGDADRAGGKPPTRPHRQFAVFGMHGGTE